MLEKEIIRIQVLLLYFMLFIGAVMIAQPSSERLRDLGLMFMAGLGPVSRDNSHAKLANRLSWALACAVWAGAIAHLSDQVFGVIGIGALIGLLGGWIFGDKLEQAKHVDE